MSVTAPAEARVSRPVIAATGVVAILVGVTLGMWAYYGTAVFFEVVRAGWAACF